MSTAEAVPVGRIETLHFARLLSTYWERGFTGSFRTRANLSPGTTVTKEILFERGRIAWAASDDPEESIRVHLINRGLLHPDQWALAEEKAGSAQIRQTLLDLGFLSARELHEADLERVTGIVLSLFAWREGRYESLPGPLPLGTPNLKLDPRDLVLEGLMSQGDRGRVLDEIGTLDAVLVVRPDDLVRASLSLPVELVGLMSKADGTKTIADICALSPLPDFMISAAFAGLKVLGLARSLEGVAAGAPPAPPTPVPDKPPLRKRSARGAAGAREAELRLPLDDSDEFETVPMVATPPRGTAIPVSEAVSPPAEEVDDPGTHPVRSEPVPIAIEEEVEVEPIDLAADEGVDEEFDREAEVELKPGIPVQLGADTLEHAGTSHLREDEIEEVIQILDAPGGAPPLPAPETPAAVREEEMIQARPLEGIEEEAEPIETAPAEEADEGEFEEEPPPWIYQPSAEVPPRVARHRWAAWGAIAAVVVGVAAGIIFIFGTGGEAGSRTPEELLGAGGQAPAEIEAPAPFSPEPAPPDARKPIAPASFSEPPAAAQAGPGQGSAGSTRGGPASSKSPAATVNAAPPRADRALASSGAGSILRAGPYKQGRQLLEKGEVAGAARLFEKASGGLKGLYTVQLALACEPETVARAVGSTRGSSQFFILPTTYQGRSCYRLLWGAYASRAAAAAGRSSIPERFLKDPHPPVITRL